MMTHSSRRHFLHTVAAGTALVTGRSSIASALAQSPAGSDAAFWATVRAQFSFTENTVPMNAANLCPAPRAVADRLEELTRLVDRDCSSQNRRQFTSLVEHSRHKVAAQLRASPDEIAWCGTRAKPTTSSPTDCRYARTHCACNRGRTLVKGVAKRGIRRDGSVACSSLAPS